MNTPTIKDVIKDVVKHLATPGFFEKAKITGTDDETLLEAISDQKSLVLKAKLKKAVPDFCGSFGLARLGRLQGICNLPKLVKADATIEVIKQKKNGVETPQELFFKDGEGQKYYYRFMSAELVPDIPPFTGSADVIVKPKRQKITEIAQVANVFGDDKYFTVKTDKNHQVNFFIGGENSTADRVRQIFGMQEQDDNGKFAKLTKGWAFPIAETFAVLKLAENADCVVKFGDRKGFICIEIDSGIGEYQYIIPAKLDRT